MTDKPLLVIRPLRDGDAFLTLLSNADIPYRHIPIMTIRSLADSQSEQITNLINRLDQFAYAIFISANAAEIGLPLVAKHWPKLPETIEFLAVGQQTGQLFSDHGYAGRCPTRQPNTEWVLNELPQLQDLNGKSVIIFRGGEGRQTLGAQLANRGAKVEYCNLYQRLIAPLKVAEAQAFMGQASCLIAHSGELLQGLGPVCENHIPVIVPSARIAEQARQGGYTDIQIADNALPQSMFDAVQHIRQRG